MQTENFTCDRSYENIRKNFKIICKSDPWIEAVLGQDKCTGNEILTVLDYWFFII